MPTGSADARGNYLANVFRVVWGLRIAAVSVLTFDQLSPGFRLQVHRDVTVVTPSQYVRDFATMVCEGSDM